MLKTTLTITHIIQFSVQYKLAKTHHLRFTELFRSPVIISVGVVSNKCNFFLLEPNYFFFWWTKALCSHRSQAFFFVMQNLGIYYLRILHFMKDYKHLQTKYQLRRVKSSRSSYRLDAINDLHKGLGLGDTHRRLAI